MSKTKLVMDWLRFVPTIPWALVGWLWVILMTFVFWAADFRKLRFEDAGILTCEWRPWAAKRWGYSTTIGRAIIFHPRARDRAEELDDRTERHERVHIWQIEDLMFLSGIIGLIVSVVSGNWLLGFFIWWSGGLWQLPNFVMAILRHGHSLSWPKDSEMSGWHKYRWFVTRLFIGIAYRDSLHERHAYASTDRWDNGQSWWEDREKMRAYDVRAPK